MYKTNRGVIAMLLILLPSGAALADAPQIAPSSTSPGGQSYGHWAAEWWQWAFGVPDGKNPLFDVTGEFCAERQVGNVWFLAGSIGTDPVERSCTVPAGTALFFPIINVFYGAFLNDPADTRTEEFVRAMATCPEPVTMLSLTVDGFAVPRLDHLFVSAADSPLFNLQLPPGNPFGLTEDIVPELVLSPSAQEGYYVFLRPLSPGVHSLAFHAEGCFAGFSQDITFTIDVTAD